jgi:hypothetical protein
MEPTQHPAGHDPFASPPVSPYEVPSGFTPYASAVAAPSKRPNPWWIAAGVLQTVQALFLLGVGAWAFAVASNQDDLFGFDDLIRVLAVIMVAVGAVTMAAAIGCLSSKLWGAVTGLSLNGLFLLLTVGNGSSGADGLSDQAVPLLWLSAIVALCVVGMVRRRA